MSNYAFATPAQRGTLNNHLHGIMMLYQKIQPPTRAMVSLAAFLILVANPFSAAWAAYTVIDDDLYPTSMIDARQSQKPIQEKLRVGFPKGSSVLGPIARASLEGIFSKLGAGVQVRVVGRTDTITGSSNAKQQGLALARASAIRSFLTGHGLSIDAVRVESDVPSSLELQSGVSVADVILTLPVPPAAPAARPEVSARAIPHQYRNLQAAESRVEEPAPQVDSNVIRYINSAVQAGQLSPSVAAQLLQSLMGAGQGAVSAAPQQPSQAANQPIAIATPTQTRWPLYARMSLRENIDAWTREAGWRSTIWDASTPFEVTQTMTVSGGFPDVLRRVSDSTGLNICVNPRDKTIRVTDPGVDCNK